MQLNVHLSAVGIGGVLEPLQARSTIIGIIILSFSEVVERDDEDMGIAGVFIN